MHCGRRLSHVNLPPQSAEHGSRSYPSKERSSTALVPLLGGWTQLPVQPRDTVLMRKTWVTILRLGLQVPHGSVTSKCGDRSKRSRVRSQAKHVSCTGVDSAACAARKLCTS